MKLQNGIVIQNGLKVQEKFWDCVSMHDIGIEPSLEPPEYNVPICPVCMEYCGTYYRNINREIMACENCVHADIEYESVINAWHYMWNNSDWRI